MNRGRFAALYAHILKNVVVVPLELMMEQANEVTDGDFSKRNT